MAAKWFNSLDTNSIWRFLAWKSLPTSIVCSKSIQLQSHYWRLLSIYKILATPGGSQAWCQSCLRRNWNKGMFILTISKIYRYVCVLLVGKGAFLSESTDVFVVTPNRRTFFFPETENLVISKAAQACQMWPSSPYKPLSFQTLMHSQFLCNFQSPKFKSLVSRKKNVCLFEDMTKTSVSSDKNVPLQDNTF